MKKALLSTVALATLGIFVSCKNEASTATSEAQESVTSVDSTQSYKVDFENSMVEWKGSKPTGVHTGVIKFSDATAQVVDGKLTGGKFVLDMNSITVTDLKAGDGKEDLESHLKGTGEKASEDHFFNVNKYPKGSFEITKITEENGKSMITGNLTLKEISKSITVPATVTAEEGGMVLKSEPFMIDRTQWNINYASKSVFDDLKDKFVDDNVELIVILKIVK